MGTTVDWNRWLPPRKIRDRGDLEFKVGQVWAWRYGDDPIVFRVREYGRGKDAPVGVEGLAREKFDSGPVAMRAGGCYVLVQDVGQPEPTPPDALWQEVYALPPDICYAPDVCTSVRVMGRDEHGKAYCWKHRALWGTVTREVEDDRSIKTMFESIRKSADEIMMGVFREAGILNEKFASPMPEALTYSNLLAPMKPLTADSILEAMKSMDAIKTRDAETKKRYDDIVMAGLKTHMDKPIMPDPYYWRPFLDAPAAKPKLTEAEITRLQWAADDGGRYEPELFPEVPEFSVPRTQSQSIAAGLGVWGTRGDAKRPPDPKPYPHVSDEDLLPDA